MHRIVLPLVVAAAALGLARHAAAGTFYVSPQGSDRAAGTITSPWRTVARVNNSKVGPGDTVLFAGGATFADTTLMPPRGGTSSSPVTFGSYGSGQAVITRGIWLDGTSHLRVSGLTVDAGGAAGSAGIASAHAGSGTTDVTVDNCRFLHVEIGVNLANRGDAGWRVTGTLIQHTADSGIISYAHDSTFANDTILDTGESSTITYGKHGIYAKGPATTITGNTISRFSADGISLRYRNAVVRGNTISSGGIGIAWFQDDTLAGTTTIDRNSISATRSSGTYVSPDDDAGSTRESFLITNNTISSSSGNGMDIAVTSGSMTITGNTLSGSLDPALSLHRSLGPYVVSGNTTTTSTSASVRRR